MHQNAPFFQNFLGGQTPQDPRRYEHLRCTFVAASSLRGSHTRKIVLPKIIMSCLKLFLAGHLAGQGQKLLAYTDDGVVNQEAGVVM